ncbi:NAD(P)H-binding protein [Actinoplanes sp. NBRC 101535]|uniref:NAD(P)-dependent oxidoreductase n=1 Tax=Actinoplanes sp. NBRC 101535 TaxID=3032196 RepID=UPI0024A117CF|nr:NAD(P)H-binding protein [Actinoplanes sp. NBRC 101535]GLY04531.1 NmrA family transcriptional regulator [Actinoplanes sp. NBRC 101535]
MRLVVLGATGRTGLLLVRRALDEGHTVTAYGRRRGDLPEHPALTVVVGSLADQAALASAFAGADAVVSCLGPALPFARSTLMSDTLPVVADAMRTAGVRRIVVLSALGVGDSIRRLSPVMRFAYSTVTRPVFADKRHAEDRLRQSDVDWTLVYPGVLTGGWPRRPATLRDLSTVDRIPGVPLVTRAEVARSLLLTVTDPTWSRRTATVL